MTAAIDPDRFCPTPASDPYWNESAWFSFSVPGRGLHGMVYYYFRPNMNVLIGGPILWDASGRHPWDCLYHDFHQFQRIPDGAQKFAFTSQTSLSVRVIESLAAYGLRYDHGGCTLDLEWRALDAPHHFLGMEIEATGASADNRMHLEQMGRASGTITLRGETIRVDCAALRDTSWGVRSIDSVRRGSYFWAVADADTAFHAQTMGDGPDQTVVGGFLRRDGITSTLASGRRVDTRMGELTPDSFRMELTDRLGRSAGVTCRTSSHLMFNGFPRCQVVWSLLRADFGQGREGWGDIQEFQPMEQFRAMVRG